MSAKLMPNLRFKAFAVNDGAALANGTVTFYAAGTSTPQAAYTSSTGLVALANPLTLDSNGEAEIWLTPGSLYRIVVKDSLGVVQDDQDNVSVDSTGTLAIASGGTGATSKAGAFDALSPMTTAGDLIFGGASGTGTRLPRGTANQVLHSGVTPTYSAVDLAADVTGVAAVANGGTGQSTIANARASLQQHEQTVVTADGAITVKSGTVVVTKAGVCAMTLAAPTNVTDDGKRMTIQSITAFAHTITQTPGFNLAGAAQDVATFGGAVGDNIEIEAFGGAWFVVATRNVTLA